MNGGEGEEGRVRLVVKEREEGDGRGGRWEGCRWALMVCGW